MSWAAGVEEVDISTILQGKMRHFCVRFSAHPVRRAVDSALQPSNNLAVSLPSAAGCRLVLPHSLASLQKPLSPVRLLSMTQLSEVV